MKGGGGGEQGGGERGREREIHGEKRTQTSKVMTETTTHGKLQRTLFIYFGKMKG